MHLNLPSKVALDFAPVGEQRPLDLFLSYPIKF